MAFRGKKTHRTSESQRSASDKRDTDFFAARKARDAENLEKTNRLRALRLAHEASLPPKPEKVVRKAKPKAVPKAAAAKA